MADEPRPRRARRRGRVPSPGRGRRVLAVAVVAAALALAAAPASAARRPEFQVPFACGERWEGSTRPTHSPSSLAVDWNQGGDDLGHLVIASAPGVVTAVVNLGNTSYGRYVVIDHGGGWTTLHAHLQKAFVSVGQRVDQGQLIALLGNSGGSTGPHLHYEQRLNQADQHARFDGDAFRYNSWLRSRNCADSPVIGDWNGDRVSDLGVYSRRATPVFRERLPDGAVRQLPLGEPTDVPVSGDWDGDGQSDVGVWRPASRLFLLDTGRARPRAVSFGAAGDLPVTGDWDGDGATDVGVFHPATATFLLRDRHGTVTSKAFGSAAAWPIAGDWDGDGRWEVGVFDAAAATFSLAGSDGSVQAVPFGGKRSIPVVGDWDGDAVSDLGVWQPATATFVTRQGKRVATVVFGRPR